MADDKIQLIRHCSWEEVFLEWYKGEGSRENWNVLARERGFASWADWRIQGYARRFECAKADWGFYEIDDPSAVVGGWFGGPFRGWTERHYDGGEAKSFAELASRPEIESHRVIGTIAAGYPEESVIVALELSDGRICVIEGMHRACALALMKKRGLETPEKLVFAIGKSALRELPLVGKNG
jgi:hypothetical protein